MSAVEVLPHLHVFYHSNDFLVINIFLHSPFWCIPDADRGTTNVRLSVELLSDAPSNDGSILFIGIASYHLVAIGLEVIIININHPIDSSVTRLRGVARKTHVRVLVNVRKEEPTGLETQTLHLVHRQNLVLDDVQVPFQRFGFRPSIIVVVHRSEATKGRGVEAIWLDIDIIDLHKQRVDDEPADHADEHQFHAEPHVLLASCPKIL